MNDSASSKELPDFDKLWNYREPAATEQKFRELIPQAENSGDIAYYAELLTQIARTQGLQRNFEEAHATLDQVTKMLGPDHRRARVRYLLERGRTFNSSDNKEQAKQHFLEAWDLARESNEDNLAVDAAHMMGIVEMHGPFETHMAWNLKALEMAESSDDPKAKRWRGTLYNNMGWGYFDQQEYQKAMDLFQKGWSWHKENGNDMSTQIAKWCVAKAHRFLGDIDTALRMNLELKKEKEDKDMPPSGYVFEELGECYLIQGASEAQENFARAYEILSKDAWLQKNEPERLSRLKKLGRQ